MAHNTDAAPMSPICPYVLRHTFGVRMVLREELELKTVLVSCWVGPRKK